MIQPGKIISSLVIFFALLVLVSPLHSVLVLQCIRAGTYNYSATNFSTYSPPGFTILTNRGRANTIFTIWSGAFALNTSWSGSNSITNTRWNTTNLLPRNDQGNTNFAWMRAPLPAANDFMQVVTVTNPSATSEKFGIFWTSSIARYIVSSSNNIMKTYADPLSNVVVFMNLNGTKPAQESVLIRYTTNNWTNSALSVGINYTGNSYSNRIPAMPSGTLVKYYVLTTAGTATNLLTTADHDYATMYCLSNESSSYQYYVAGTWHTVAIDGTNDFNTNSVEQFLTTTPGYTNWITWDQNFLYMGFYGADIGSANANKLLYVYFGTNTNTNSATGWAYGNPEGTQLPVLPFKANYFFRKSMSGAASTGVATNGGWSTAVSPLSTGTSNVLNGNYLELRIHRTNFQNSSVMNLTNLNIISFMMDTTFGSEKIYAASPSNTLMDGNDANPSNYIWFRNVVWLSNQNPSSNVNFTNDVNAPYTNAVVSPLNGQTNVVGDIIAISNFAMDMAGIYRVDIYTNSGLLTNMFVSNSNANYILNYNTSAFKTGTYIFSSIAYDTKNKILSATTNTNFYLSAGSVYLPGTWNMGQFNTPFTNLNMPTGFIRATVTASLNNVFLIHNSGWSSNHAWSFGYNINMTNIVTNIPRNNTGTFPAETNWATLTVWPAVAQTLSVVSVDNPTNTNLNFGFMTTGAVPVFITASSNNIVNTYANANSNVTVFITISGAKSSAERIVARYTTNNFAGSMVATATLVAGNNYTATIPAMGSGLVVKYYIINTAMSDLYLTNGTDEYATLACLGYEDNPYVYYTAGTYDTVNIDGTNDFNTNNLEMFLTSTAGYTNWVTWDSNFLYVGYYGADIGANDANKMLYVYFSTNTNTATNLNLITGSAYGEPQGTQLPVLPFKANYFFRFTTTGVWDTAVWTNNAWNSNVSPLDSGISVSQIGDYFEMRINKTNFANLSTIGFTNLDILTFMLDATTAAEQIYGASPANSLVDGYAANPTNFRRFTQILWISNIVPNANGSIYATNDAIAPYTNGLLNPVNNKTNNIGDIITISNYTRDETGIYKLEFYTNAGALYTNFFVTNTNAVLTFLLDTSTFSPGTNKLYTIAYDTRSQLSSATNNLLLRLVGKVYVPESRYDPSQFGNPATNTYNAPGFVSFITQLKKNDTFMIHKDGWANATAWSGGMNVANSNITTNISRNDQGSSAWATLSGVPIGLMMTTFISKTNISATSEKFGILQTSAYPTFIISSVDDITGSAYANSNVNVSITLNSSKCNEERIVIRYTTNNWTTSMVTQASGSGVDYTAIIPPVKSGSFVQYYVIDTSAPDLFVTNGDHDLVTLACFSNQSTPFSYYVSGTLHTIAIDGANDFNTNDAEIFPTTTDGYTNWVTWDSNYLYLGFYGPDIGANDANKMLYIYLSTNTNTVTNLNLITGSAYGEAQGSQTPVLPFTANFFIRFLTTGALTSGVWSNNAWNTAVSPLTAGITQSRTGNYLEMKIGRTNFMNLTAASFTNLGLVSFMLNKTSGSETIYSAMPGDALADGFNQALGTYLFFETNMWISNLFPSDPGYESADAIPPYTNRLLWPTNNQAIDLGTTIVLSNFSRDETGIYYIEVYTNNNALYNYFWVTNTNAVYSYSISTTNFNAGTYNFYTMAYDTANVVSSQTNTNVTLRIRSDLTIYKSISSIVLPNVNLLKPGALINYQMLYTNAGPHSATNVVVYDRIPDHTSYYTNYLGTATGWTPQYSHITNPDQSYGSVDYDASVTNVIWFRWKKLSVSTNESGSTMFLGVTVN